MKKFICIAWISCLGLSSIAMLELPSIFSEGMVLQQGKEISVWGKANPHSEVVLQFLNQHYKCRSDEEGRFLFSLEKMKASSNPQSMHISSNGKNIKIDNILIGEVWLCSGQSNMQWPVKQNFDHPGNYHQIKSSCANSSIRMFNVGHAYSLTPLDNCEGSWKSTSSETIGNFSAVGYFFGKELYEKLNVPIGLIHSSWGGTRIEAWSPMESLEKFPSIIKNKEYKLKEARVFDIDKVEKINKEALDKWKIESEQARMKGKKIPKRPRWRYHPLHSQHYPANLYNAMIHPLKKYNIQGAIWYQGESNTHDKEIAILYKDLLKNLTTSWRNIWSDNFSFYAVQLVNYMKSVDEPIQDTPWPYIRQSFLDFHKEMNNGSIVVGIDIGDPNDIHPRNKHIIGYRLAQRALVDNYGWKITPGGPIYKKMKIDGNKILIEFDDVGLGLVAKDANPLRWFAIAGKNQKFEKGIAIIKGKFVEVSHPMIQSPKAVRYAWADNPQGCNLFNRDGFPASPFRTDDW